MARFDIDEKELGNAAAEASLQQQEEDTDTKTQTVRSVPVSWPKIIKRDTGLTFAAFARLAIKEKMVRDGLIAE